jgi:hypothetical protein
MIYWLIQFYFSDVFDPWAMNINDIELRDIGPEQTEKNKTN